MKIHFINSQSYWFNGWFIDTNILQTPINILKKAGFEVNVSEVENTSELEKLLDSISQDTLVWSNAYYVKSEENQSLWLNDFIEKKGMPYLASGAKTLRTLLNKDECQIALSKKNIPIPSFLVIKTEQIKEIESLIISSKLQFPLILKPTSESGSVGVLVTQNLAETIQKGQEILQNFPLGNLIIEEFLPGQEITCGFFQLGEKMLFVPTYYTLEYILDRKTRLAAWDKGGKEQLILENISFRNQLKEYMPQVIETLNIKDISRVDARADKDGILRFFDINGFPGLAFPRSVTVQQAFTCFPNYSQEDVYKAMIHTLVCGALLRYNKPVPNEFKEHNLFTLESNIVLKKEY